MILPVRRGGLDRQQKKYPFARRKKKNVSQRMGAAKIKPPLCGLPTAGRLCSSAPLREEKKRMSRKEGEPQRLSPPFAAWRLCERLIKKL